MSTRERELDIYLRRACRGLFGRRRQAVREELRANILECALDFQAAGCSEAEALALALREFGAPARTNAGLLRVHTLPAALNAVLLAAALSSLAFGAVSLARANEKPQPRQPTVHSLPQR